MAVRSESTRWEDKAGGGGRIEYEPMHPDKSTTVVKPDLNRAGYTGMADGIQSEASTKEAERMLEFKDADDDDGLRVRNPGLRARYTSKFNVA